MTTEGGHVFSSVVINEVANHENGGKKESNQHETPVQVDIAVGDGKSS